MATKVYDAVIKSREYQDNRTGEMKAVWQNVGAVWQNEKGDLWLTLEAWFNPAGVARKEGQSAISVAFFAPKPQGN
jgi:hypothetical protein